VTRDGLRRTTRVALAAIACVTGASAQTPSTPPRDTPTRATVAPASAGDTAIRGRVIDGVSGQPLRNAEIHALPMDLTGVPNSAPSATTDADGGFVLTDVSSGRYRVMAAHNGYIQGAHGQARPLDAFEPVVATVGRTTEIDPIPLFRGGIVSGLVVDDQGDPVVGRVIQVVRRTFRNGFPTLSAVSTGTSRTNDLGAFAIGAVPPGDYLLVASENPDFTPGGDGGFRTTFYPATTLPSEGRPVHVEANRETSGLVIAAIRARPAKVSGMAVRADGEPALGATIFRSRRYIGVTVGSGSGASKDGRFSWEGMSPADYEIWARIDTPAGREQALVSLPVSGDDVRDVVLTLRKDVSVRGRIVIDGEAGQLRPGDVRMRGYEIEFPDFTNLTLDARADWTFETTGHAGLTWLIRPATLPAGWYLERVTIGGRDVTDTPTLLSEDVSNMEIVLTRRATVLTGRVSGTGGARVNVVVFSTKPEQWTPYPRFIRRVGTDAAGAFEIRGLPPGSYGAVALPSLPDGEEGNPELLNRWLPGAARVELREAESGTVELSPMP
jgi:hypothetical protein